MMLRVMTAGDISDVVRIAAEAALPQWSAENYANELANPAAHFVVAETATTMDKSIQEAHQPQSSFPRTRESRRNPAASSLDSRVRGNDALCLGITTKVSGKSRCESLVGFAGAHIVVDEVEVLVIAVATTHLRQGIGHLLLSQVLTDASERGARRAWLDVRTANEPAFTLYQKHGFAVVSTRRRYYKDGGDALIMSRVLD